MTPEQTSPESVASTLQEETSDEAYMFQNQFYPNAEFRIVSGELEWVPQPEGVGQGSWFTNFNTRLIQYTNAPSSFAFFFPYQDAAPIEQGTLYELSPTSEGIEEDEFDNALDEAQDAAEAGESPTANIINVEFSPTEPGETQ